MDFVKFSFFSSVNFNIEAFNSFYFFLMPKLFNMKKYILLSLCFFIQGVNFGQENKTFDNISGPTTICQQQKYKYSVTTAPGDSVYVWSVSNYDVTFYPSQEAHSDTTSTPFDSVYFWPYTSFQPGYIKVKVLPTGRTDSLLIKGIGALVILINDSIHGKQQICKYKVTGPVTYTVDSSKYSTTYQWILPDSCKLLSGQGSRTINVRYNKPIKESDIIKVYPTNFCDTDTIHKMISLSISYQNIQDISVRILNNKRICETETIDFTADPTGFTESTCSYSWFINNNRVDSGMNHRTWQPKIGDLKNNDTVTCKFYTDKSVFPCYNHYPAIDTVTIQVDQLPQPGSIHFSINQDTICQNDFVTAQIKPKDFSSITWKRQKKGESSPSAIPTVNDTTTIIKVNIDVIGTYDYWAELVNGACKDSISTLKETITISEGFDIPIIVQKDSMNQTGRYKDSILFICKNCGNDTNRYNLTWAHRYIFQPDKYKTDTMKEFQDRPFCMYKVYNDTSEIYFLKISVKKGHRCEDSVAFKPYKKKNSYLQPLNIFPNPNNGIFTISINREFQGLTVLRIIDLVGKEQLRFETEKKAQVMDIPIDVGKLKKGVYLVEAVFSTGERLIKKIIIY